MKTQLAEKVIYHLPLGDKLILMNEYIGKNISIRYENEIHCICCGARTKKSYSQGYCYECFLSSPETSECILRPELCRAHEGKGRDFKWEKENHLQEHFVYLALSSSVKVGVTRSSQVPVRWIDQGASSAICLAKTPNRYLAGVIEVEMKKYFTDKTNWQKMLRGEKGDVAGDSKNLVAEKRRTKELLPVELLQYYSDDDSITTINYPVINYPKKVKSIDLEKTYSPMSRYGLPAEINFILQASEGLKLVGIKGQYLIFENGSVLNVRRHSGYVVCLEC